jgi:hypothetical protein
MCFVDTEFFCAVKVVGMVSLALQRFPFAACAEYLPSGR